MAKNESSSLAWFLAGVTGGVVGAILYAPRAGRETRGALGETTRKGRERLEKTGHLAAERGPRVLRTGAALRGEAAHRGREASSGKEALGKLKTGKQEGDEIEEQVGI